MTDNLGPGSGPDEGIYLATTLAIVEQQVNERLDALTSRRKMLTRGLIVGLLVTTLGGGAATAAALSTSQSPVAAPVLVESTLELHCVDGAATTAAAYFTARFTVRTIAGSDADLAGICGVARSTIRADDSAVRESTPAELLDIASAIVTNAAGLGDGESVLVAEASFGVTIAAATPTVFTACERSSDGRIVVLATARDEVPPTVATRSLRCNNNSGYQLYTGAP